MLLEQAPAKAGAAGRLRPTVSVVINTFNDAEFLPDALDSVVVQTIPPDEIIVVDDGSDEDPGPLVAARYPGVRFLRQDNQGLAAARNTGLNAARSEMIVFLDADDKLLPNALESGLDCFARAPACGFVFGGHRRIDTGGEPIGPDSYHPIGQDPFPALLCGNLVGMHATVMYHRERLLAAGAFDPDLRRCEDYDVYLRMSRRHAVASHAEVIAEYRQHGHNMSRNHAAMLRSVLQVHSRHRQAARQDSSAAAAWSRGRGIWRRYYSKLLLAEARTKFRQPRSMPAAAKTMGLAILMFPAAEAPAAEVKEMAKVVRTKLRRHVPEPVAYWAKRLLGRNPTPPPGRVSFGDFSRTAPISQDFGFDRGTPIDRHYVENFLAKNSCDIKGRVLEVGDDAYTRRFGGGQVARRDVLHVTEGAAGATIIGDMSVPGTLPPAAFDCLLLTQTLHLIYDMPAAVAEMHRALKPGGVALVTVPGISQIDRGEWGSSWYWSLTRASALRLFGDVFGTSAVAVEVYGNVFAATSFLQGVAVEEVDRSKLGFFDEAYPVTVGIRARKAEDE
jgi:SAM-dependent methyltransferase